MKSRWRSFCENLACLIPITLCFLGALGLQHVNLAKWTEIAMAVGCAIASLIIWIFLSFDKEDSVNKIKNELQEKTRKYEEGLARKEKERAEKFNSRIKAQQREEELFWQIVKSENCFSKAASMYADFKDVIIEGAQNWLLSKDRPIAMYGTANQTLTQIKQDFHELIQLHKAMQYKYEFLLAVFPELENILNNETKLLDLPSKPEPDIDIKKLYQEKTDARIIEKKELNEIKRLYKAEQERQLFQLTTKQNNEHRIIKEQYDEATKKLNEERKIFELVTLNNATFKNTASLYADYKAMLIEDARYWLLHKKMPIRAYGSTDETLKQLKKDHRTAVAQLKEMQYKYDFLLSVFPELATYLDDEQSLAEIAEYDIEDVKENYDRVIDFVPREEYERLTPTERNQLALDRYVEGRKKSARIAGFDYEMYCCHKLRQNGFEVEEFGIQNGLEDLGRDIIAKKGGKTYVIQCKRYKKDCQVHENTICQIFGTSIHYRNTATSEVVPVLITTGEVSKTAREFAEILNVEIRQWEMEDYPRIKANINNGQKIYHLPFDQQYWRTIIEPEKGEAYYMTVAEAEQNGFRRAMRHTFA